MAPTTLLMLCLLAATLLGAGVGACLHHLRLTKRHRRTLAALRESGERERRALDAMLLQERERGAIRHEEACRQVARERDRSGRALARHDALAEHAKEQTRLVESLRAELRELEARHLKGQRDLADERLPVLNRRVDGRAAGRPGATAPAKPPTAEPRTGPRTGPPTVFPIGGDLDIPTLAESELPDAEGDLVLDLLDTGNLFRDVDER